MRINQNNRGQWERRRASELLKEERQASIHWQCSLGEKEAVLRPAIGEVGVQVLDRVQDREVLVETENHDTRPNF